MIKYLIHPLLFLSVALVVACGGSPKGSAPAPVAQESVAVQLPRFDADSAYAFVEAQVNFGPRVPNSAEHRACGDYLESMLKGYGAVRIPSKLNCMVMISKTNTVRRKFL